MDRRPTKELSVFDDPSRPKPQQWDPATAYRAPHDPFSAQQPVAGNQVETRINMPGQAPKPRPGARLKVVTAEPASPRLESSGPKRAPAPDPFAELASEGPRPGLRRHGPEADDVKAGARDRDADRATEPEPQSPSRQLSKGLDSLLDIGHGAVNRMTGEKGQLREPFPQNRYQPQAAPAFEPRSPFEIEDPNARPELRPRPR